LAYAIILASSVLPALAQQLPWPIAATEYCEAVRTKLKAGPSDPPIDPTRQSTKATFELPKVTKILDQRVEAASRRAWLEGTAGLGFIVTDLGRVEMARVIESSNQTALDQEALAAISGAEFTPAQLDGKAVASCMFQRITFRYD
jgi:TonB family protein